MEYEIPLLSWDKEKFIEWVYKFQIIILISLHKLSKQNEQSAHLSINNSLAREKEKKIKKIIEDSNWEKK